MSVETFITPASRYEAPDLVDFADSAVRVELTRVAVPALARLAESWQLGADRMCGLLGGISQSTWYSWKQAAPNELSVDQLTRASYLLGIYSALQVLFRAPLADQWVTRPNTHPLFGGPAPIELMVSGGIVALSQVREMLDGAHGGM